MRTTKETRKSKATGLKSKRKTLNVSLFLADAFAIIASLTVAKLDRFINNDRRDFDFVGNAHREAHHRLAVTISTTF